MNNNKHVKSAKRMKALRQRAAQDGKKRLELTISGSTLDWIDKLVEFYGVSGRAAVVESLLKKPLIEAVELMQSYKQEQQSTLGDIELSNEATALLETVKSLMWSGLVNGVHDEAHEALKQMQDKINTDNQRGTKQ